MIYIDALGKPVENIKWKAPTTREDGTAYVATDHLGYELGVGGVSNTIAPFISVPAAYNIVSWPIAQLNLKVGDHKVYLRTVPKVGVPSQWSSPLFLSAKLAPPSAPTEFGFIIL